ncbi:MAG: mevalonate kinase [Kiritimatiellia bacterium]|jgi:glucuronokinase
MIIKTYAYPRAGLVGNPSDGYFGKTISFVFSNFRAEVTLFESPDLEILANARDLSRFKNISHLADDVCHFGYYGGIRLLKATMKRFYDYCQEAGIKLPNRNCTISYHTNIPSQVGLAGSSAIITACLRALMQFYEVKIPLPIQPNLILSVENRELGISAGLQDRVVQAYEGLVYMDFDRDYMQQQGHGRYERLDPSTLPLVYIAYRADLSEGSEVFHNDIRGRFARGEKDVVDAMRFWADLTDRVKECLLSNRSAEIGALLDANFDQRCKIYKISSGNLKMVEVARTVGASAKFSGSGGAIVGTYTDEGMFARLRAVLAPMNVKVFKPTFKLPDSEDI